MLNKKNQAETLPPKTVERLSQYRRELYQLLDEGKAHVYSHEIAALLNITSVQVRRDIMLLGYTGSLRKGYEIKSLIDFIGKLIDTDEPMRIALVGAGNLGTAIMNYFKGKRTQLSIVACFDINPNKVGTEIEGVFCYHTFELPKIVQSKNISIAILTVPNSVAFKTAQQIVESGIKGILNYTSTPLHTPDHIYLEEYDMTTSMEKVAYFVKHQNQSIEE
ncbi:MAG: redox-sensing transcriptional repressor Rex [Bacteroidota bacterium]|jgi:redox-sensing transcriptional repressor